MLVLIVVSRGVRSAAGGILVAHADAKEDIADGGNLLAISRYSNEQQSLLPNGILLLELDCGFSMLLGALVEHAYCSRARDEQSRVAYVSVTEAAKYDAVCPCPKEARCCPCEE